MHVPKMTNLGLGRVFIKQEVLKTFPGLACANGIYDGAGLLLMGRFRADTYHFSWLRTNLRCPSTIGLNGIYSYSFQTILAKLDIWLEPI